MKTTLSVVLSIFISTFAYAEEQQVGRFVQMKGQVTIQRSGKQIPAEIKAGVTTSDTVSTGNASRAKMLFIDDSVLTLADNSKLVVKEFIYSKGEQGKSVFNLLDGKMRSVVGKTKFEVHTPTAVAAARGTVIFFDVGIANNQNYSKIICLEGNVQIKNVATTISGQVTLTPGTMVVVKSNEPPPPPIVAPPAELEKARKATQASNTNNSNSTDQSATSGGTTPVDSSTTTGSNSTSSSVDSSSTGGAANSTSPAPATQPTSPLTQTLPTTPPIQQQPIVQPRKVNINIGIPVQ